MSRKSILAASAVALAMGTGAASAADIYAPPPPATTIYSPVSAFSWTGAYVGGLLGYGWGNPKSGGTSWDADGITGGVFGGYNFQTNQNLVLGIETDIMASGMEGKKGGVRVTNPWNGTIRARAGFAFDRVMVYGTGGLAVGDIEVKIPGSKDSKVQTGYTLGAGVEAALTNTVIGRVEYRYTDYGKETYSTAPKTKASYDSSQVLVGIGVKF